ncbi:hypothetical protein TRVL_08800 [Trypanosoma vivax]|nr:hypothetical protein TRVL_08800 [Trypanosoma vivax]
MFLINSYLQQVPSDCCRFSEFLLPFDERCPLPNCSLPSSTWLSRHLCPSEKLLRLVHCDCVLPFPPAAPLSLTPQTLCFPQHFRKHVEGGRLSAFQKTFFLPCSVFESPTRPHRSLQQADRHLYRRFSENKSLIGWRMVNFDPSTICVHKNYQNHWQVTQQQKTFSPKGKTSLKRARVSLLSETNTHIWIGGRNALTFAKVYNYVKE